MRQVEDQEYDKVSTKLAIYGTTYIKIDYQDQPYSFSQNNA